jgi:glycoside/pentoside/hexuronide:cation symporter, GPH family
MMGRVIDLFTDPIIGVASDRAAFGGSRFRFPKIQGRRRPFIFWGSILMTFTGVAFWYPPVGESSTVNFLSGTFLMSLHWVMYTLAYIPLLALAPEIARSRDARVKLGTWIGIGMILGLVAAALAPGILIDVLDPARRPAEAGAEPAYSAVGYQRVAWIFAGFTLLCFQFFVWTVRERDPEVQAPSTTPAWREMFRAFEEPLFRRYFVIFFLFYLGLLSNQRAIPYWAELGLQGNEATVSMLGIPFMVTCLLGAVSCLWLCKQFELKWLVVVALGAMTVGMPFMYVIAKLPADPSTKFGLGALVYALKGAGLGMMYVLVTPLIGEIIDKSAEAFGERREAVFNAMHAVMVKAAQTIGIGVAVFMMGQFGNSVSRPEGALLVAPVSSLFCFAAMVFAIRYPVVNSVRDQSR